MADRWRAGVARWAGIWRRRVCGAGIVGAAYGLPVALPQLYDLKWHWFGGVWFLFGEPLSFLPGVVLVALLAPLVAYRRRDALTMLFPLPGVRLAWIIGTRLSQLPRRDWPARADGMIPLQGRRAARLAVAVNGYRRFRSRWTHRAVLPSDATGVALANPSADLLSPADSRTPRPRAVTITRRGSSGSISSPRQ